MSTAFQADAFQNDAFQVSTSPEAEVPPGATSASDGYSYYEPKKKDIKRMLKAWRALEEFENGYPVSQPVETVKPLRQPERPAWEYARPVSVPVKRSKAGIGDWWRAIDAKMQPLNLPAMEGRFADHWWQGMKASPVNSTPTRQGKFSDWWKN